MTWEASLWKNYTDGILVMHHGEVVYERYFGALDEAGKHAAMSMTKSLTGTLAAILVAEGKLDPAAPVTDYVPEVKDSAFGDATVRQVMNMTTGLDFSENYADPDAEIWEYSAAGNPLPKPKGYEGPVGYYAYLETVKKQGKHGEAFGYRTVNADMLGWIVARAADEAVPGLLSERLWQRLGMEQNGYYSVDELGTPFAGGGFNAGLRDMARFGQLMLDEGKWRGERLFPASVVENIREGGSPDAFAKAGYDKLDGWSYRNMWWITHNDHGAYMARGVHGQALYIDPAADMVIARFASHPLAANSANDPYSLPAYQAVADYLINHDSRKKSDEDQ
jgi:CubicO group peptidase (beta-lactamase class C family)